MSDELSINGWLTIPGNELSFVASRASGSGGQHVNKTSSRVTLRWDVAHSTVLAPLIRQRIMEKLANRMDGTGVLQLHVDAARSQLKNRETARERLRSLVLKALERPKPRRATKPSKGAKKRRLDEKKRQGQKKADRKRRFD
jgi:ribosome-associated protein